MRLKFQVLESQYFCSPIVSASSFLVNRGNRSERNCLLTEFLEEVQMCIVFTLTGMFSIAICINS